MVWGDFVVNSLIFGCRIPETQSPGRQNTGESFYQFENDDNFRSIEEDMSTKNGQLDTFQAESKPKRKRIESIRSVEGNPAASPEIESGK